jgi:hypothetical protein
MMDSAYKFVSGQGPIWHLALVYSPPYFCMTAVTWLAYVYGVVVAVVVVVLVLVLVTGGRAAPGLLA